MVSILLLLVCKFFKDIKFSSLVLSMLLSVQIVLFMFFIFFKKKKRFKILVLINFFGFLFFYFFCKLSLCKVC